jgi:hypothetical protein
MWAVSQSSAVAGPSLHDLAVISTSRAKPVGGNRRRHVQTGASNGVAERLVALQDVGRINRFSILIGRSSALVAFTTLR